MLSNEYIDSGKPFDWSLTSGDYARYRDIYPKELYERLRALGVGAPGTSWLDLGCGTGILPQNLYHDGVSITGVDIASEQIRMAQQTAEQNGWHIHYFVSGAECTGLPNHLFDCITAAQCFWYFDRDVMQNEIRRLLKPNGIFIKVFLDWDYEDAIAAESIALIKKFNPAWNPMTYGEKDVYDDLFEGRKTESFCCDLPFTRESWHGRMCACRGTRAAMDDVTFEAWSRAHIELLSGLPSEFTVKHQCYITYFVL